MLNQPDYEIYNHAHQLRLYFSLDYLLITRLLVCRSVIVYEMAKNLKFTETELPCEFCEQSFPISVFADHQVSVHSMPPLAYLGLIHRKRALRDTLGASHMSLLHTTHLCQVAFLY